jgi:isoleucyl-tRNA synthetase
LLNTLIKEVGESYETYEPTRAGRAISEFVSENLSNWFVRLSRKRYWGGSYDQDKISAYQTLYTCLETVAILSAPIAPFFSERLFLDLNNVTGKKPVESIHIVDMPVATDGFINADLEERMQLAQKISSMVLSLRKRTKIKVRQPLNKIMIPVLDKHFKDQIDSITKLILSEVNVKELEFMGDDSGMLVKQMKPNFKTLGPRYGKMMKQIAVVLSGFTAAQISNLEQNGKYVLVIDGEEVEILLSDVEINTQDIPGWIISTEGNLTVALDITMTDELREEGIARDLVNKIQNLRKDKNFDVTDKINLFIEKNEKIESAIQNNFGYICSETLAKKLDMVQEINADAGVEVDLGEDIIAKIDIEKAN